ncbi:MAG TPA: hypothetical protein PJ995_21515 [Cyclobacteriaceae bacterium]|nr:hypothetical protein [Cyclobacteriaceae bacterium]HMX02930.1 hypothetical protein [Cyclobacteriaceae bacterium]
MAGRILQKFSGPLALNCESGTTYLTHNQSGAITFSSTRNQQINGWALVPIVADGSAINIPSDWIKYGGDNIDITAGVTNHFMAIYTGERTYWTNKVTTP